MVNIDILRWSAQFVLLGSIFIYFPDFFIFLNLTYGFYLFFQSLIYNYIFIQIVMFTSLVL